MLGFATAGGGVVARSSSSASFASSSVNGFVSMANSTTLPSGSSV